MKNSFLLDPKVREKGPPKADLNQVLTLKTVEGGGFCPELRRSPAISHSIILLDFIKKHPKYKVVTVFPHIVAAATILFWIHLVRKLFKLSFPLCNKNLNSFLTRWGNYSRRGNYSREETIWGNTVFILGYKHLLQKCDILQSSTYSHFWWQIWGFVEGNKFRFYISWRV